MDLNTLIEFPGILITIGVCLILISVIIIVIAYRAEVKDVDATSLSTYNNDDNVSLQTSEDKDIVKENNTSEVMIKEDIGINDVMNNNININQNENIESKDEIINNLESTQNIDIPLVDTNIANVEEHEKEDITEVLPTINAFDLEFNNEMEKEDIFPKAIKEKEEDIKKYEKEEELEEDIELL